MELVIALVVGLAAMLINVTLQSLAAAFSVRVVAHLLRKGYITWRTGNNLLVIHFITCISVLAALAQMAIWSWVFLACGEFEDFGTAFHQSMMNYTTLGFGDVTLSRPWQVLGPLEAANGILMFGLSTAILFAVMSRMLQMRIKEDDREEWRL